MIIRKYNPPEDINPEGKTYMSDSSSAKYILQYLFTIKLTCCAVKTTTHLLNGLLVCCSFNSCIAGE
jgi:hypothetical protein